MAENVHCHPIYIWEHDQFLPVRDLCDNSNNSLYLIFLCMKFQMATLWLYWQFPHNLCLWNSWHNLPSRVRKGTLSVKKGRQREVGVRKRHFSPFLSPHSISFNLFSCKSFSHANDHNLCVYSLCIPKTLSSIWFPWIFHFKILSISNCFGKATRVNIVTVIHVDRASTLPEHITHNHLWRRENTWS